MNKTTNDPIEKDIHPRELAEETLQILIPYMRKLSQMSSRVAQERNALKFNQDFLRLVEGLQLTHHSFNNVKDVIGHEGMESVYVLETQLHQILIRLLAARKEERDTDVKGILRDELSPHLESWSRSAIPQLIRSRDC